jgi:type II secretory pathway pseudopilin PulG
VTPGRRRGFALVAALISVVLLGGLIVGAFVAVSEQTRTTAGGESVLRALMAAESAAEGDVPGWAEGRGDSLAVGSRTEHTSEVDGFQVTTTLVRLNTHVFWLIVDAGSRGAAAPNPALGHRRVGLLLRRIVDSAGRSTLLRLEERAWSELF